jgi:hypothetical protein
MSNNNQHTNLYTAFGIFIDAFRPYIISVLMKEANDKWPAWFVESLNPDQRINWNTGLRNGAAPENLIDYHYLKGFAIKYRQLLVPDFARKTNDLPNWLGEIAQVRHGLAHFQDIDEDEATKAWIHMTSIAKILQMTDLQTELNKLRSGKMELAKPQSQVHAWYSIVTPHFDIRQGRLDESVFAANLAEVALGSGRELYKDPIIFFSKTYITAGLKSIAKTVIGGLNGNQDAENRVISLQTGFGGGKTHTLISLYHLCKWGKKAANAAVVSPLLQYTGMPNFDTANIAVFTNTTNDAAQGRQTADGIHIQTIWGELAYQLGGVAAYNLVRKNDEQLIAPAGTFKRVLEHCQPALILIDELADYCVKASARKAGNSSLADQTISFMQELTEAVAGTENCVLIVTLPASPQEVGNTPEAQAILSSLQKRVSRVGADTQPVAEDEVYEVIRRRLFEDIGDADAIAATASQYIDLYQQHYTELPNYVTRSEYKQKIIKSYPFHPELIDVFRIRWASHHDFQRTRGVLRLLAAIVSDLWKQQQSIPGGNLLIHTGQVNLAKIDALSGQLKKLYGNGYDAVISADVAGSSSNAYKIDSNKDEYGQWHLTQSITSVILLNSFGSDGANKGVSVADIKLQLLMPNSFNHNSINGALTELEAHAYYLYYAQTGGTSKRYWFHTKPNINILINQAKSDIKPADIESEILRRLKDGIGNKVSNFKVLIDPPTELSEQKSLTLMVLSPRYTTNFKQLSTIAKETTEKIATKRGNSERIYRNTILFLLCSEIGVNQLQINVRDYLACQKIRSDYASQLEREQNDEVKKRIDEANKASDKALIAAYSMVAKYSVKNGIELLVVNQEKDNLEQHISDTLFKTLKQEEWLLESVGLGTLRNNNLLPTPERAIKVKDVYEAFIRYDDKPMISTDRAVSDSLLRYCTNGEYCIATGDGASFTAYYLAETVPYFNIDDDTYWLVHKSLKPVPQPLVTSTTGTNNYTSSDNEDTPPTVQNTYTNNTPAKEETTTKVFKSITISGRVAVEQYTQLFSSFVMPLAQNNIEIEVRIKAKSTTAKPLGELSQEYKIAKESAKQLGLNFEEE